MLIAIDIGNSRIKTGKFLNNKLIEFHSFNNIPDVLTFLNSQSKNEIAISSVVPDKTTRLRRAEEVLKLTVKSPFIISKDIKTNLTISYKTPDTLGTDRLCSAEGAFFLFKNTEKYKSYNTGTYILSIDFGTATTINVIEHPGKFIRQGLALPRLIGGLIAPGLEMMFESLQQKTAQLPHLDVSNFISTIGEDTNSSIASGVVTSVVGMIERTIYYLEKEKSAKEVFVYLTGGNAKKIIPHLDFAFTYEEGLVLYGINALYELNKNL
jgi:type III pantothenate kinase